MSEVKNYVVSCPQCSASLSVTAGNYAFVCPVCNNMFRIRIGEKMVKDLSRQTVVEAYVNVNKDNVGDVVTETVTD